MAAALLDCRCVLWRYALPIGPVELVKRTSREIVADDVMSLAAQQAYYFFFALFPALLTLICARQLLSSSEPDG